MLWRLHGTAWPALSVFLGSIASIVQHANFGITGSFFDLIHLTVPVGIMLDPEDRYGPFEPDGASVLYGGYI
ncbi:hypothetical protein BDW59DRAFT_123474 [Aspergillus cavernicola]|uniref:Uncharacterized protein n=1 Tax=Aspergillus cavernicola TaxID=176166 RepID=A0ABR4HWL8_9EURO